MPDRTEWHRLQREKKEAERQRAVNRVCLRAVLYVAALLALATALSFLMPRAAMKALVAAASLGFIYDAYRRNDVSLHFFLFQVACVVGAALAVIFS